MAKNMKRMTWLSLLLTGTFAVLHGAAESGVMLTLTITFGTTSYHLAMRLLVGAVINRLLNNHVDYRRKWFRVSAV